MKFEISSLQNLSSNVIQNFGVFVTAFEKLIMDNAMIYANVVNMKSEDYESRDNLKSHESAEQLIINIAQNNCRESYKLLFSQFAPKIKSFMIGQGVKANEAEDIAQDTMLKIWRKAQLFDPKKAKASTWIFTIARNLQIDAIRKQKRHDRFNNEIQIETFEADTAEKMISEQSASQVKEVIKQLPAEQLQVLKLSFYEDLSHSQIAQSLSIPVGTVKSRLRLALGRLKSIKSIFGEL